jgi:hypothetical protein
MTNTNRAFEMKIRRELPSVYDYIFADQVSHFCDLCDELVAGFELVGSWPEVHGGPEYEAFMSGAYACGMVCRDIDGPGFEAEMNRLLQCPRDLLSVDILTVRYFVHTLLRASRFELGNNETGVIYDSVRAGALRNVSKRLREFA